MLRNEKCILKDCFLIFMHNSIQQLRPHQTQCLCRLCSISNAKNSEWKLVLQKFKSNDFTFMHLTFHHSFSSLKMSPKAFKNYWYKFVLQTSIFNLKVKQHIFGIKKGGYKFWCNVSQIRQVKPLLMFCI